MTDRAIALTNQITCHLDVNIRTHAILHYPPPLSAMMSDGNLRNEPSIENINANAAIEFKVQQDILE